MTTETAIWGHAKLKVTKVMLLHPLAHILDHALLAFAAFGCATACDHLHHLLHLLELVE